MGSWILMGVGGVVLVGLTLWLLLIVSMRTKFRPVLDSVRRLNRAFSNPRAMKAAGKPGATYSVIRHEGRISGRSYQTPVGVVATDDGFVIALPYGPDADWVENVLKAGTATILDQGNTFRVGSPRVVHAPDVDRYFSFREKAVHRLYGVAEFLVLHLVESPDPARPAR